ncbi:hybrid sensor histidine kinase/response regulator [Halapricum salinum]|uniref:histidine kinase n=1 Tax=Halapricum salinum TaxID=1457250 RepID=A0A4D6HFY4_9EURY|nr:ATP-binding protein [Halapricum salinum]QCC52156.1 hybrid sensor histidine kinase/response regulator [Halapricum salinum]
MALQESHLSVLLAEDNPGDARLVERYLETAQRDQFVDEYSLTHVEDLAAGLERLGAGHFDVLLLDLGLPGSTGIDTLDRAVAADPPAPIVVLTGFDDGETALEAIKRGAQDYLPKDDLDSDRLIRAIRYAIERHDQEQRLQRQTEQMEFFNQILRHDMLNGMNVIRARGDILAEQLEGEQATQADTIVDWSDDIIDLTEKVRSILTTLTDDESRDLRPVDLEPVATAAAERARSMGATVGIDVPDDLSVRADGLLEDVLANLTTNAVEHGGAAVTAEISATRTEHRAVVRVEDDGSGIPEDERDRIFERGQKGAGSTGTGFGLYFVDSMLDAYGGSVSIEESDLGGAAIVLELPTPREYDD